MILRLLFIIFCLILSTPNVMAAACLDIFPSATNDDLLNDGLEFINVPPFFPTDGFLANPQSIPLGNSQYQSNAQDQLITVNSTPVNETSARLYLSGSVAWTNAKINVDGNPEDLIIVISGALDISGGQTEINAIIYAYGEVRITGNVEINGAVASEVGLSTNPAVNISYDQNAIENTDFNGMCDNGVVPPISSIPILDYRFDECSYSGDPAEVIDQSGNYNADTNNVPSPIDDAIINKSIDLSNDDTSDWLNVPKEAVDGLDGFTISTWIKTGVNKSQQEVFHALGNNSSDDELEIYLSNSSNVYVKLKDESDTLLNNITLTDGQWHHLALTRIDEDICLYVDGDFKDCSGNYDDGALSVPNDNSVIIGQEQDSIGGDFDASQSFEGQLDEFKIYDTKLSETAINALYQNEAAAKNYDGTTRDAVDCDLIELVAGRVTLNNTADDPSFTHVCFDEPFSVVPVVFSLPTTASNVDRLALRIRNVTVNGFDIAQVESRVNRRPPVPEGNLPQTIDFLAIVEGDYDLDGGAKMRVSTLETKTFQGRQFSGNSRGWDTISTADLGFSQSPAIIASIQTMNNEPNNNHSSGPFPYSEPFLATTIRNVNNNSFQMALERGETNSGTITSNETIGYIAITPGFDGQLTSDVTYESFRTNNNVSGINSCRDFNLNSTYSSNPLVIASQNTRAGGDGGWLKRCSISTSKVGFSIVEDGDRDMDTGHVNERAGGLALGGTFKDFTNSCSISTIDHFEINTLNAQGITCEADQIIIKACADASCSTVNPDAVDVKLFINNVENKTVTVSGNNGTSTSYSYTSVGNASLSLDQDYECKDSNNKPCIVDFKDSGFIISDIPMQISGKPSSEGFNATTLSLRAVETNTTTGACINTFPNDTDVAVNLSYSCAGGDCKDLLALGNNGNSYDLTKIATAQDLNFSTDSTAIFTLNYPHAGKFIINAQKDVEVEDTDGNKLIKDFSVSSNAFVERPFGIKLDFSNDSNSSNALAQDADGSSFKKAGESFTLTATAMQWVSGQDETGAGSDPDGVPDDFVVFNQNTLTAENFTGGEISINNVLLLPNPGNNPVLNIIESNSFNTNTSSLDNKYSFDDVGIIELKSTLASNDYLGGGDILGAVTNVGRFTPAYFTQTVESHGSLNAYHYSTCDPITNDWAYAGQTREIGGLSVGAISYKEPLVPIIHITAYNLKDGITQNYTESGFMKLVKTGIDITEPVADNEVLRLEPIVTGEKVMLSSVMTRGEEPVVTTTKGVVSYTFNESDDFVYEHTKHSKIAPFQAKIPFIITRVEDGDNINLYVGSNTDIAATQKVITEGVEIRFGRWQLDNSYGPETSQLPVTMVIQHFDGSSFITNDKESCLVPTVGDKEIPSGAIGDAGLNLWDYRLVDNISDDSLSPSDTDASFADENESFVSGLYRWLLFSAPGASNVGSLELEYQVPPWLQYDWNDDGSFTNNPTSTLTFGIYRGNDRIIYQREISR